MFENKKLSPTPTTETVIAPTIIHLILTTFDIRKQQYQQQGDLYPMDNTVICQQIAALEDKCTRIFDLKPHLGMDYFHSLPHVQEIHHQIAELELLETQISKNQQPNHHQTSRNNKSMNTTPIIKEDPDSNTDDDPTNINEHILGPSNHLIFTAA
mmetsp:Transcript_20423/g.22782  ORF Transcript_20423/g.22782 Transcript_20423/m.22782 type:complete len:155 (-) Transcript_20423:72-536(-)